MRIEDCAFETGLGSLTHIDPPVWKAPPETFRRRAGMYFSLSFRVVSRDRLVGVPESTPRLLCVRNVWKEHLIRRSLEMSRAVAKAPPTRTRIWFTSVCDLPMCCPCF